MLRSSEGVLRLTAPDSIPYSKSGIAILRAAAQLAPIGTDPINNQSVNKR